jgi:hypothetical protein
MGEENRGSSGGGTVMIVLAILGGVLVVGCCGGIVAVGLLGTLAWKSSPPPQMQMQPPLAVPTAPQLAPEVTKALDDLNKEMEPLKIAPEETTPSLPGEPGSEKPEVVPPPEEKKE